MATGVPGLRLEGAFPRRLMDLAVGMELSWGCRSVPQLWSSRVAGVGFSQHGGWVLRGCILSESSQSTSPTVQALFKLLLISIMLAHI